MVREPKSHWDTAIPCHNNYTNTIKNKEGDEVMNNFDEVFSEVPNTNKRYYASSYGYVYDMKLKKVLPTRKTKRDWYDCKIWFGNIRKTINVHRVIAMSFLGENDLTVNHIDGDKSNNRVENLEYQTLQEQNWHRSREIHAGNQVSVYCQETGDIYPNAKVAGEILGIKWYNHISGQINNKYGYKSVCGYHFTKVN